MLANVFCSQFFNWKPAGLSSYFDADVSHHNYAARLAVSWRRSRRLSPPPSGAAEKEETRFEIDREKAREALQKLDQQLQTLSQQESIPKERPSPPSLSADLNLERDRMTGMRIDEMPEISGSYLSYVAVALLILTIFNNIIFNAIIKPSVDGTEQASKIERVPLRDPAEQSLKQLPQ